MNKKEASPNPSKGGELFTPNFQRISCVSNFPPSGGLRGALANCIEAGCDEAGRGCLAGAVFAAAVILPENFVCQELNDSKKLTEKQRYKLRPIIEETAIDWAVGTVSPEEIDKINILNASFLAMHRAIDQLKTKPEHLIIDGNRFNPYPDIPHKTIIKGDGKFLSIAAASVLAKTYRDDYMMQLHEEFPQYDWCNNKGYPTQKHRQAIKEFCLTEYHRKSFNHGLQLELF